MSDTAPETFKDEVRCSTPNPDGYTTPDQQFLETNGRSISSLMSSRYGLKGTVIPRATRLGGSRGYDPNEPAVVNVDPDDRVHSCTIDLGKLTPQDLAFAYKEASSGGSPDLRAVAAATYSRLAEIAESASPADLLPGMATQNIMKAVPENYYVPPPQPTAIYVPPSPLPQTPPPVTSPFNIPYVPQAVPQPPVLPDHPTKHAIIEIDGLGQIDTWYHEIVFDGDFLILAYDTRYKFGTRFMPQRTEAPVYVKVTDGGKVFKVQSVGIRFTVAHMDQCVLLVEEAANLEV